MSTTVYIFNIDTQRNCFVQMIRSIGIIFYDTSQFGSVAQSCLTLCDPMNRSMPGLPVHHQLSEFTQTHVHWFSDAIQPSHPLSSPSPLTFSGWYCPNPQPQGCSGKNSAQKSSLGRWSFHRPGGNTCSTTRWKGLCNLESSLGRWSFHSAWGNKYSTTR